MNIIELPTIGAVGVAIPGNPPGAVSLPGSGSPQGVSLPPGYNAPGGGGQGTGSCEGLWFSFPQSALQWTVNHNLGRRPVTELYDAGGREFFAEILAINDNQFIVYFIQEMTGFVRVL